MTNLPTSETIERGLTMGPGKSLQKAREALNLIPEEIAAALHLDLNVVDAIESEEYNRLPHVYMRGYIRAYARIVGLDPEPLVEAYNKLATEAPTIQPWARQPPTPARSHDRPVKAVTYLVIAILGALLFIWWQNREAEIIPADLPLTPEEFPSEQSSFPQSPAPAPNNGSSPSNEAVLPALPPTEEAKPAGPDATVPADTLTPSAPPAPEAVPGDATVGSAPTVAQVPDPSQDKSRSLVLMPSQDSWMGIVDAKGAQLYHGLAKGGETVSLQGEPPFKVTLGNAQDINVLYNGKPMDIGAFSRGGVARFKVGDNGLYR
jgi:cytoskeleton protein RodZ